ncbi:MAG: filamentous hemagglutinin N-terminal domain-containing protein, partial [Gammaproteobacteria bacterium]|nr:filamentous hemagglutinin N-terminal domain-containing protein [Gammaproteobacteria bacterium]MBT4451393.1 filamentous hemagglutinin N-terminal domain-containing protein [Gammaproteobacteria bacterium]
MKHNTLAISIGLILGTQVAYANPNGAQVIKGTATFSNPSTNVLNINNSRNAIINWQTFNIGKGQTTNFTQPSTTSSVLNRVISNNPSNILGNLNSNGRVFLINQHGILVGEGANINTSGFFGSTLNITDSDFLNGKLKFQGGGQGNLENQGYIRAGENGNVVLIAPNIENGGVIEVDNGNIILAAGKSITITSLENSSIEFEVTSAENQVTNLGKIIAKNGAASLFAGSLKHSGSIRASGLVQNADGSISLVATDHVEVSGSVDVSGEKGGHIEILGDVVDINDGANINASGISGGGEILIGGDQQGLNPDIVNATSTTITENAQVHADAIEEGDGGKVIVFAENDVHVHGEVTAKGGQTAGDGGFIETSGLKQLDITSVPDASAVNGEGGEWLIDPNNITLVNGTGFNIIGNPNFTTSGDSALLDVALVETALNAGNNVTISTGTAGTNLDVGNISIAADINKILGGNVSLTFNAHNNIIIDTLSSTTRNITSTSGILDVVFNADIDNTNGGAIYFETGFSTSFPINIDTNGGQLVSGGQVFVGGESIVNINNTQWDTFDSLDIDFFSTLTLDAGAGTLFLNTGNNLSGSGTVNADVILNGGSISGGSGYFANGNLNINGALTFNSGLLYSVVGGFSTDWTSNSITATSININGGNLMLVWEDAFGAGMASTDSFFTSIPLTLMSCGGTGCMTGAGFNTIVDPMLISNSNVILGAGNGDSLTYSINYATDIVNNANIVEWGAPTGDWSVNTNWNGGVKPAASDYVFISNVEGLTGVSITTAEAAAGMQTFGEMQIDTNGSLTLSENSYFTHDFESGSGSLWMSDANARMDGLGVNYSGPGTETLLDLGILAKDFVNWGQVSMPANSSFQLDGNLANLAVFNLESAGINSITGTGSIFNFGSILTAAGVQWSVGTDLTLQPGSTLDGTGEIQIQSTSILTVDSFVTVNPGLTLTLNNGTIDVKDFFTLPDISNFNGGTLTGLGDFSVPDSASLTISGSSPLTLSGVDLDIDGVLNWLGNTANTDIVLNDSELLLFGTMFISNTDSGAQIDGTNGSLFLANDSYFVHTSAIQTNVNVPVTSYGKIGLNNAGSILSFTDPKGLVLENGGRLFGIGSYAGDVQVNSGGGISPGIFGTGVTETNQLSINGNLSFESGSALLVEIEYDGADFDRLLVSGNVVINGGNLYTIWKDYNVLGITTANTFDLISAPLVTGSFDAIFDAPGIASSTGTIIGGNTYQYSPASFGSPVVFWDGDAGDFLWSNPLNWSGDALPGLNDNVVMELAFGTSVLLSSLTTPALNDIQLDNLSISVGGDLKVDGNLLSYVLNMSLSSNVSGAGTLHNASTLAMYSSTADITIANLINYGFWGLSPLSDSGPVSYTVNSANVINYGGLFVESTDTSTINSVSFTNGISNAGNLANVGDTDLILNGTINNELTGLLISAGLSKLTLANSNTNLGSIMVTEGAGFTVGAGTTLTLSGNSNFQGDGTVSVPFNSTLDIQTPTTFDLTMTLELLNGTIDNAQNLSLPDTFNIYGGILSGTGVLATDILSEGFMNINSAAGTTFTISNLDLDLGGTILTWSGSSGDDFVLDNSTLTIRDQFEINNSDSVPEILGTGNIVLAADSYFSQFSSGVDTVIGVPVTTRGLIEVFDPTSGLTFTGGDLTLKDGARLSGFGTITVPNVFVSSGGGISPGWDTGTGTLNIDGNVTFENDSVAVFEINNNSTGFDQLNVTGNITINGGNLFVLWDDYSTHGVDTVSNNLFDLMTSSGGMVGPFTTTVNPLGITSSSANISTVNYQYQVDAMDEALNVYWTGLGDGLTWEDTANWVGDITLDNSLVIVEIPTADYEIADLTLNSITANLAGFQNDSNFHIGTGGNLQVSGDFINNTDMTLLDNGTISGTGTWHNLSFAQAFTANTTLSIANINNYSALDFVLFTTDAVNLTIASNFENWGNHNIYLPTTSSNTINYSGGLTNHGLFNDYGTTADLIINGVFNNDANAEVFIGKGNVVLNATSTLGGLIDVVSPSVFTINGGTHNITNGLVLDGNFDFTNATLTGVGGTFTTLASSQVVMDDPTIQGLNWLSQGTVDWIPANTSASNFILDTATFTNQGTLLLQNINAGSFVDIVGTSSLVN